MLIASSVEKTCWTTNFLPQNELSAWLNQVCDRNIIISRTGIALEKCESVGESGYSIASKWQSIARIYLFVESLTRVTITILPADFSHWCCCRNYTYRVCYLEQWFFSVLIWSFVSFLNGILGTFKMASSFYILKDGSKTQVILG